MFKIIQLDVSNNYLYTGNNSNNHQLYKWYDLKNEPILQSQNFERINHPFTVDPTYINKKFSNMKDEIFIHQCGRWPC